MSKQEVVEYVLHTPYNTNPTILNQKLDELIEEESGKAVTPMMQEPLPKLVTNRYIGGEGDILVDCYNQNLHADADEVIDAFFDGRLLCHYASSLWQEYQQGLYFGVSNFGPESTPSVAIGFRNIEFSQLKYISSAEARDKIVNHILGYNTKGEKTKKKLVISEKNGYAVDWLTGEVVKLADVINHQVENTLFLMGSTKEQINFTVCRCRIVHYNGTLEPFMSGSLRPKIVDWDMENYKSLCQKIAKERHGEICFYISGLVDWVTGEPLDAETIVESYLKRKSLCWGYFGTNSVGDLQPSISFGLSGNGYYIDNSVNFLCPFEENGKFLFDRAIHPYAPLVLQANKENTTPQGYLDESVVGDIVLEGIKNNKQILVRTPNSDDGIHTAIYSPVLTYQLPNYENDYLYLFYLRDEKQDLSEILNVPIELPTYGQLKLKLSNPYYNSPLE